MLGRIFVVMFVLFMAAVICVTCVPADKTNQNPQSNPLDEALTTLGKQADAIGEQSKAISSQAKTIEEQAKIQATQSAVIQIQAKDQGIYGGMLLVLCPIAMLLGLGVFILAGIRRG